MGSVAAAAGVNTRNRHHKLARLIYLDREPESLVTGVDRTFPQAPR